MVVGNTLPYLDGIIGTNLFYKAFNLGINIRYSFGADVFNEVLYNKIENIDGEALENNQDKRALYDRWKKPGDVARYKSIAITRSTPMSDRFVQRENYFRGESINAGYELSGDNVKALRLSYIRFNAYMNDIFRVSTIQRERGIDYPFANTFAFSISVGF